MNYPDTPNSLIPFYHDKSLPDYREAEQPGVDWLIEKITLLDYSHPPPTEQVRYVAE